MKKLLIILVILAAVIVSILFAKDIIIKASVEKGTEIVTGLKLDIGSLHLGIFKLVADIKNLQLRNPAGFSDKTMVDMPEIYVSYDLAAIVGGKIHLPEVRLALKEFVVVKDAQGKLNLDALKSIQAQKEGKSPSQKTAGKAPDIKIDLLKLSIGKVIYKDYSKGGTPEVKEFNINFNESYSNINDPYALANMIVVKALMNTSIANLTNFDLKGLQGTMQQTVTAAQEKAKDTVKQASDTMKDLMKNPFESGK